MPSSPPTTPVSPPRLTSFALRRPRLILAAAAVLFLLCAVGMTRLTLRTDGHALIPPDHPVILFDDEVREHFGLRDPIVVFLQTEHPEGIFNPDTLRSVTELTERLGALPNIGPENVTSLASERRDRVYTGTLNFRPFLDPFPDDAETMATLRGDVEVTTPLTQTLVSEDRSATAVLVGAPPIDSRASAGEGTDRTALSRRVREIAGEYESELDRLSVVGAPVAESLLGVHILEDLALLVPLAMAVIALMLWWGSRRPAASALGLTKVGVVLVVTFGTMGWLGVPVYLTTAVLPVVLTTIALADEIHILWHYQRELAEGGGKGEDTRQATEEAITDTFVAMGRPVILTSLTTGIGFLSFLASPIPPVSRFGAFAAFGLLVAMLWSLAVTPALLALVPARLFRRPAPRPGKAEAPFGRSLVPFLQRRRATLALLGALTLFAAAGLFRLYVEDSWVEGFAPGSPFRTAHAEVNRHLFGTHLLLAHLDFSDAVHGEPPISNPTTPEEAEAYMEQQREAARSGGLLDPTRPLDDPSLVEAVGRFEDYARSLPGVGGVQGPKSHLEAVAFLWLGRQEEARKIPESPDLMRRLYERFDMGRGEHRRRELVDDERRRAVVTLFLKEASFRRVEPIMEALEAYAGEHLAPLGAELAFAGDVAVSQAMIPAIVRTQVESVVLALAGALLLVSLVARSFRRGLLTVAPAAVSMLWVLGGMGWLGVPLGVATSMFCAILLGIGVDDALHFLARYDAARADGAPRPVEQALAEAGPAIVHDTLAISLGFGLLLLSQVPANARLGLLVALGLAASCVLTLLGLAALLRRSPSSP